MPPQNGGKRQLVGADQDESYIFHHVDIRLEIAPRAEKYSSFKLGQEESEISFLITKIISRGVFKRSLFLRNNSLIHRLILFLSTAPPTFLLTTTAIREKD